MKVVKKSLWIFTRQIIISTPRDLYQRQRPYSIFLINSFDLFLKDSNVISSQKVLIPTVFKVNFDKRDKEVLY